MIEKYPHDELVRAWLDGKTLQYLDVDVWIDIPNVNVADKLPHLYRKQGCYRIKPVTILYRVALMAGGNGGHYTESAWSLDVQVRIERNDKFVRWLTDWTEVLA